MIIDTHAHLSFEDENLDKVIESMKNDIIVISGTNAISNKEVIELCNKYTNIYGTLGIHPSEIDDSTEEDLEFIKNNLSNPKIIGVGEIGIDLYWRQDNYQDQVKIFIQQLEIARTFHKTIVIHTRNSKNEIYQAIEKYQDLKMIFHCYDGDYDYYKKIKEKFNAKFGIGGVVTFKNSAILKDFITKCNLEDIVLETDSPYLAPEPFRGRINEPKNVNLVANKIAEIKDINLNKIIEITTKNALDQFDLDI
jgi:TatD DNase family protein